MLTVLLALINAKYNARYETVFFATFVLDVAGIVGTFCIIEILLK